MDRKKYLKAQIERYLKLENKNILIKEADKSGQFIIENAKCHLKMKRDQVNDEITYKKIIKIATKIIKEIAQ